jgi:ParB-like chromosome segregation protein Spo0J
MIIEKKKLSELKPAPYNPRQSTEKQETQLKQSLEKFGVVEPIIYNKQTGYIVGGHFRVRELKKLGYKEIECVIVDLNEEDERELNIRLNANTGEWDWSLLNEWDTEQLEEWGLEVPELKAIDEAEEGDEIKIPKSLQVIPKKEYILIMADEDSEEWQELQQIFQCGLVRQGGCKIGSSSDKVGRGTERVFDLKTFKERVLNELSDSNTK